RQCWICFSEEQYDKSTYSDKNWVKPCKCKGTTQWVHQKCILDWIFSKVQHNPQNTNSSSFLVIPKVQCPQCHYEYKISQNYILPKQVLQFIDWSKTLKDKIMMYASLTSLAGSLYLVNFVYGSASIYVCIGAKEFSSF